MAEFLTDAWFKMVESETNNAGELNLTPAMQKIHLNIELTDESATTGLYLKEGRIHKGNDESAETTVQLPLAMLISVVQDMDTSSALQAFIDGDIRVNGDMSQLMALRMARVSDEQKALFAKILLNTSLSS